MTNTLLLTAEYEEKFWPEHPRVCGIDEAGRGPLAGPVVAAAVVFPRYFRPEGVLEKLNDSKALSPERREELAEAIRNTAEAVGIAVVDHLTIDRLNIFRATMLAMNRAAESLAVPPSFMLIDGNRFTPHLPVPWMTVVRGDAKVFSIAAASVMAKTHRDRLMKAYASQYPDYGFERHFGYPTKQHIQAIVRHGRCPLHRRSFRLRELDEK